jgi:hypothetical protein
MTTKGRRPGRPDPGRKKAAKRGGGPLADALAARYARAGAGLLADDAPQRVDPRVAAELAPLTGADPESIRIHTGTRAGRMAGRLGARAFALPGGDVFFAKGEFAPESARGKALLAHEMTHVAEGAPGRSGPESPAPDDDSERVARDVERMVLAREDGTPNASEEERAEPVEVDMEGSASGREGPRRAVIDKAVLEDKVHRVLERALRRERERSGR